MASPTDRFYTPTHEWFKINGDKITLGITQFAVEELTDITYVELPAVGRKLTAGQSFGEIESVKATSELYAPVAGEVVRINDAVKKDPSSINTDPYEVGWLVELKVDQVDTSGFLTGAQYDAQCSGH